MHTILVYDKLLPDSVKWITHIYTVSKAFDEI